MDILWQIGRVVLTIVGGAVALVAACFILGALAATAEAVGHALGRFVRRRRRARARQKAQRNSEPSWVPTLLVDAKEAERRLHPIVQLRGHGPIQRPVIHIELVDRHGVRRHTIRHRLTRRELGKEIALPAFAPPEGTRLQDALAWRWDVILEDGGKVLGRWEVRLASSGGLDPEAQLDVPEHTVEARRCTPSSPSTSLGIDLHRP